MSDIHAKTTYLKDYTAPAYTIASVRLTFKLYEDGAEVSSRMEMARNPDSSDQNLRLDGEDLELRSLKIDGLELDQASYQVDSESLIIDTVPEKFILECTTWIKPQDNKRLEGLYKSASMFCTQCEAEGFRRITYYLDRPDVMSVFETRIEADKSRYPVLLSNGNEVDSGGLDEGRHYVSWQDPFPKPCYLFALVAGDLHCQKDTFVRQSGRPVALKIFVDHKNSDKCDYALDSLKRSMKWDEETYGREYDLDIFMIVAVDDFNMGAMENKGLNIFNSSCVLAKAETTTDAAYLRVEAIVAHEYFHNWSGNRVTCRDWFQLSLKEGFTVYRDSQFSADMNSAGVKRIDDVNLLRTAQFAEDAGPMSHPIRPASYMEISNFYTLTVYEKGAEVVGMLRTLLGPEKFREGSDLYFDRHDGQAVTTEDFVAAMTDISGKDLGQFKRWYDQGGTPDVYISDAYDAASQRYTLIFEQSCPATPGQKDKAPFHIPIALGLLDSAGNDLSLPQAEGRNTWVFELTKQREQVVFENVAAKPVPSLLRGFSAPVKLHYAYAEDDLLFLMSHDSDSFNRWNAGQSLALNVLQGLIAAWQAKQPMTLSPKLIEAYRGILNDTQLDKAMVCKLMMLPTESYLIEVSQEADVDAIHAAREFVRSELATALREELTCLYLSNNGDSNDTNDHASATSGMDLDYASMSRRALKNSALSLLSASADTAFEQLAHAQLSNATNMTDGMAALSAIVNTGNQVKSDQALSMFHQKWKGDAQVMEQWFAVQSASALYAKLPIIKILMSHVDFDISNPNKVRSVVGVFCNQNFVNFHDLSGDGYRFLADQVITLDDMNPQIASRLLTPLTRWRKYNAVRQALMVEQLKRVHSKTKLSKDVREVVEKSLPVNS